MSFGMGISIQSNGAGEVIFAMQIVLLFRWIRFVADEYLRYNRYIVGRIYQLIIGG